MDNKKEGKVTNQNNQNGKMQELVSLTDQQVADYLKQHSNFFSDKPELLENLQLPHPTKSGTISLVERQVSVLQKKNAEIQHHLNILLDSARANDLLFERTRHLVLNLLNSRQFDDCLDNLFYSLQSEFDIDYARLLLMSSKTKKFTTPANQQARLVEYQLAVGYLADIMNSQHSSCEQLSPRERKFIFEQQAENIGSALVVPLRAQSTFVGILAIASRDPDYYHSNLNTLFLSFIADVLGCLLKDYMVDV